MNPRKLQRVLIAAGGTGGHIFPGLAVAEYLREQAVEVHWLGSTHGLEVQLVNQAGVPLHCITIQGLRGHGWASWLCAPWHVLRAILQSFRVLRTVRPDLVLGMGGFVSGPTGIATWLMRITLLIHEQNAVAGLSNRILARCAKRVLEGFEGAFPTTGFVKRDKVRTVGNPVRQSMTHLPPPALRFKERLATPYRLLVIGGSAGAKIFNEIVPTVIAHLPEQARPLIWHQCGSKDGGMTSDRYATLSLQAHVAYINAFIEDMAQAYAWADVVLCRAGALTISELCAVGVGAVLVPYPYAVDDHQAVNARVMTEHQAAVCIPQSQLTVAYLSEVLQELAFDSAKRLRMAEAAYALRSIYAVEKIFQLCKEISF